MQEIIRQYDEYVVKTLQEADIPGAAIAIVKGGNIVYLKTFGVREFGRPEKIDPHTVFRVASVSKGFAAILTALFVEEGKLRWEDPVIKYLPRFSLRDAQNTRALTITHLLNHTTGLPPHTYDHLIEAQVPFESIISRIKEVRLSCGVGTCYAYQNVMYGLIGEVLRQATGYTYEHLLLTRLFVPLEMYDASSSREELLASRNHASPHVRRHRGWRVLEVKPTYYSVPAAAGVNASITDLAKWMSALLGARPEVLPPTVIRQVTKPLVPTPRERRRPHWNGHIRAAHYGLGWRIFDYAGHTLIFHSGGLRGYVAQLAWLPEHNLGMALLSNCSESNGLMPAFLDMYLGLNRGLHDETRQFEERELN
ncbi:MAG: beta-lactamase family protein [candidate division KSB1 bacterium]|nr:beta-lactamase family protein [candidate division KSB1 bacterium]MDZ7274737.1 beta-lactamase family protein [candidate division KSB1 bacterium]MDZ7285562.1 beta-lactamase family protein [candidate division KSB1 bacterium]MDZ7298594.1 beta-lactamase family protein [candidate division KSB1 bacterium]MDZ7306773.1 beta-lactamase family protein [candidate division KSB1 bacterium]